LFGLAVVLCALAAAASVLAQGQQTGTAVKEARQAAERSTQVQRVGDDPGAVRDRQRYEEIEIMRRILDDGLRRAARARTQDGSVFMDFDNDGPRDILFANAVQSPQDYHPWLGTRNDPHHQGVPPMETVEGLYLRGHGVVYTAG